jgi:ketosteroid isomerase-like protein
MKNTNNVQRVALLAALLLPLFVCAGRAAQKVETPSALRSLVEAERSFARASVEKGMKEAFLAFAADDGIVFRRGPVNAKETWRQTDPAPTGLLTWQPIYADISRAGDLGYTTGPYEFREKPTDKEAAGNGHYVTLWRAQPDGTFKFVLDFGIRHAAPAGAPPALLYPRDYQTPTGGGKTDAEVEAARTSLLDAEHALAKDSAAKGASKALLAHAGDGFRLYRQNTFPVIGREAVAAALDGKTEASTWQPAKAEVARSGDLGYAYGTYQLKAGPADEKPTEQGNYMRIWKRQGGQWRVVLDVTNPVRPQ